MYNGHSIAVAETASTFFEGYAFNELTKELTGPQKIKALHNRIQDDMATVFRQIACFNFELELHKTVRSKGWVPKEEIAAILNKHMQSYLGKAVKMNADDGYFFVSWSHIRRPFYVYSYAYGQLISKALLQRTFDDPSFIEKVDAFLAAGQSATPEDIFGSIGIDVRSPAIFKEGLKSIERDVTELEKLAKQL